ncbi:something about silencing protein 10 [Ceratina calcarata]|uniref:Something about silencing protein 10 n=1 Tax=Ceratina calcarata TaxID=156304 RepID=A0AAJ7N4A8_9HYME|nr:something about silencing protein 10 [Ceratina calcarata]
MKDKKRSRATEESRVTEDLEDVNLNEVTDSEAEYSENERRLLEKVRSRESSESYDSDYEVYGVQDENEPDQKDTEDEAQTDSMGSDIEGLQEDLDLPDEKAWGKKKRAYYSTDYVDPDYATASQKDLADAEMEEEEAKNIQKRLAEQLDDADFGLDLIETKESNDQKAEENAEEFIKTDLSKLSKRQKQAIMQKESPEFIVLVKDFKDRMIEARDLMAPFLKLVKKNVIPNCPAVSFAKTKYHLLLNYCINISFYLMLKAKRSPVNSHPVIKRLAQYRQLLNQLESGQGNLIQEIREILEAEKQGEPLYNIWNGTRVSVPKRKTSRSKVVKKTSEMMDIDSTESESEFIGESEMDEKIELEKKDEKIEDENPAINAEEKRAITYQIAKNKGLTPHRKKEQRNPRVKHRNKYRKANIRRKGAVREVRKEITRYAGEISGIKAGVKKSIKLK